MMLLDIKDSIKFIENRITPLLENKIAPARILEKVIACLRNDKGQSAKKSTHYTFISIRDVKDLGRQTCATLASSQVNKNSSRGGRQLHDCHALLIGVLTDKPKIIDEKELAWNYLYLEDDSGALSLLVQHQSACCIGKLVLIKDWKYMPCYSSEDLCFSYIEAISSFFDILPVHGGLCQIPPKRTSGRSIKRNKDFSGKIKFMSPVFDFNTSTHCFLIKLDTGNVAVVGHEMLHWRELLKPNDLVVFANTFNIQLNSPNFKTKLIGVDKASSFTVTGASELVKVDIANATANTIVNYTGVISKCTLVDDGIFELDRTYRLVVSHSPGISLFRGLRVGAVVDVYNAHLLRFDGIVHLCCCALSTVKIKQFSFSFYRQRPFFAGNNILTKDCFKYQIKDYLMLLKVVDFLCNEFNWLTKDDSRNVVLSLLSDFFKDPSLERNIFSEFLTQPHHCIISADRKIPFPNVVLAGNVLDLVKRRKLKESENAWITGERYDRMYDSDSAENLWAYQVLSQADLNNVIIVGEFKICSETGNMQLTDSKREIGVLFIPQDGNEPSRQRIQRWIYNTISTGKKCILGLKKYTVVSEKFKAADIDIGVQKTYLIVDPFEEGNICFMCDESTENDAHDGVFGSGGRKRKSGPILCEKAAKSRLTEVGRLEMGLAERATSTPLNDKRHKDIVLPGAENESIAKARPCLKEKDICTKKGTAQTTKRKEKKAQSNRQISVNLNCVLVAKDTKRDSFCDAKFVVVFIGFVSLPYAARESNGVYSSNVEGTLIGEICNSDEQRTQDKHGRHANDSFTQLEDSSSSIFDSFLEEDDPSTFVPLENKKIRIFLKYSRELKKQFSQLQEGNLYVFEIEEIDISNGIIHCDLESSRNAAFYLAEMKRSKIYVEESCVATLTDDVIELIRSLFRTYCRIMLTSTVRIAITTARDTFSSLSGSYTSFSGIISSRDIKLNRPVNTQKKAWANGYFIKLYKNYAATLCLRVNDILTADEITVYINLEDFDLPDGLLPGAFVECKKLEISMSKSKNLYCSARKCSCFRVVCFNQTYRECLQQRNTICSRDLSVISMLKTTLSRVILAEKDRLSHVTWQLDLDFIAVRWASIFWRCRACRKKVAANCCTYGCLQRWQFFCQMSVIVGDGSGEVYLQIEQELLKNLLSFSPEEWTAIKQLAKIDEISYVKEPPKEAQEACQSGQSTVASKRKLAESDLRKLFMEIHTLGPFTVDCRLFNNETRPAQYGPRLRAMRLGSKEYLMQAPREINLQAIRISTLDYASESQSLLQNLMSS
ncbi:uncharacterized protein LOC135685282 isoform X2 [Rhopilema esculentum]|uniref:uncharacterized protein LOC135685282 isoform X2 n=1 Tax=Rhopilema esculentum TaxID=499914 RepID=UPI0031D260DF